MKKQEKILSIVLVFLGVVLLITAVAVGLSGLLGKRLLSAAVIVLLNLVLSFSPLKKCKTAFSETQYVSPISSGLGKGFRFLWDAVGIAAIICYIVDAMPDIDLFLPICTLCSVYILLPCGYVILRLWKGKAD